MLTINSPIHLTRYLWASLNLVILFCFCLATVKAGEANVTLEWTPPTSLNDVGGYYLYYGKSPGNYSNQAPVDDKNRTYATVSSLENSTKYYFVVKAFAASDRSVTSGPSNELDVTTGKADFSAAQTPGTLEVTFTDNSTGYTTRSWDFGDAAGSTSDNKHTYAKAGDYNVKLTLSGPGVGNSITKVIKVVAPTSPPPPSGGGGGTTNGLVAAYNFNEPSGTTVTDVSGKGNHGVIAGAVRTTLGKSGNALSFDGVDDWVTIKDSDFLDLTTGMTLEAWVYPTSPMNGWRTILFKEQPNGVVYYLDANSESNVPATGVLNGGEQILRGRTSGLPANVWTHLAATYAVTASGATQRLYVNGKVDDETAGAGSIQISNGALRIGGNSIWGEYFKGYIDEVRIYNRALSDAEIQADMGKAVTATSSAKLLLGAQTAEQMTDSNPQGVAEAFKSVAKVSGMATYLSIYVNGGSTSAQLVAGLYSDNNGHPGRLLTQGSRRNPKPNAWNKVSIPATAVKAKQMYWIAVLSPTGVLQFSNRVGGLNEPCETSAETTLTALPDVWTTGVIYADGPLKGYGVGY